MPRGEGKREGIGMDGESYVGGWVSCRSAVPSRDVFVSSCLMLCLLVARPLLCFPLPEYLCFYLIMFHIFSVWAMAPASVTGDRA